MEAQRSVRVIRSGAPLVTVVMSDGGSAVVLANDANRALSFHLFEMLVASSQGVSGHAPKHQWGVKINGGPKGGQSPAIGSSAEDGGGDCDCGCGCEGLLLCMVVVMME